MGRDLTYYPLFCGTSQSKSADERGVCLLPMLLLLQNSHD